MTRYLPAILMVIGGVLLIPGGEVGPGPGPSGDVFSQCCEAQRVAEIAILRELSGKEFPNDSAKLNWVNSERIAKRSAAFIPYTDALAVAIDGGKVKEFADALEASR
jgi:hypothetical protein